MLSSYKRAPVHRANKMYFHQVPASEPVTKDEVKDYMRIRTDDQDDLIDELIKDARHIAESFTRRVFMTHQIRVWLDAVPCEDYIELPRPPLQSITSVKWYDDDDTETVFSSDNYIVSDERLKGRITLVNGAAWPTGLRRADGLVVDYKAGYGDDADDVPERIKRGIIKIAGSLWTFREDRIVGTISGDVPVSAKAILRQYRVPML